MKDVKANREHKPINWKKEIIEWIKILAVAAAIAFVWNTCIAINSWVPSGSMEHTIMTGDRLIGSRLAYRFGELPERGDIVVFQHKVEPGKDKTVLVKRIIGLPGETVEIRENQVYINGSELPYEEPYLPEAMKSKNQQFEIPAGCYLMLGDNRNHSTDARDWSNPYVSEKAILGKILFRYFPGIKKIQ